MSIKEINEAIKEEKAVFGIRQVLKLASKKKLPKSAQVFIAKDAREETITKLENAKVDFEVLKKKDEIAKDLGLDFESEVFLIQ
jgi:uncharacterized membrane protein